MRNEIESELTWMVLEWGVPLALSPALLVYALEPSAEVRMVVMAAYVALTVLSALGLLMWFVWRSWTASDGTEEA